MVKLADEPENPLHKLSAEQLEAIGREFDELHEYVKEDLGERDAKYIRSIIELHRRLGLIGRAELLASTFWPTWILGTATLSVAKILENMEIGHNVLHGQWDWMNDPVINSQAWDWDTASTSAAWKHSHNYVHHTYTNIRGKDKDLGYEIMRIDPHQPWHPVYLAQPFYNVLLMALFEWGVAFHDLDLDAVRSGEKSQKDVLYELKGIWGKALAPDPQGLHRVAADERRRVGGRRLRRRGRRRSAAGTACGGRGPSRAQHALAAAERAYNRAVAADAAANVIRNVWSYSIIFCGHFPDQTYTFSQEETEDETTRRALRAPADRRGQHRGRPALPRHERQPRLPGRAPPLPGHAEHALRRDRARRCARSASATTSPTTPGRWASSSGWCSARSSGSRSPAARSGRSRAVPRPEGAHLRRARDGAGRVVGDLSGEASVEIAAPVERCFAIAADVERAPDWQGAMRSARALQRGAGGRPCSWRPRSTRWWPR